MRVYLGCTVRGDRTTIEAARHIARRLEEAGHEILTTHLLSDDVEGAERRLSSREVYERDVAWVESSDVLVAEASGSSYGVGFEVGYLLGRAPQTGQRAVVFYRRDRADTVSRLISGLTAEHARVFPYESLDEIDEALAEAGLRGATPQA
jgi:2'-deoxynucleoside 5'-phosphate N-hydrolase